jgi:hypothetical protein
MFGLTNDRHRRGHVDPNATGHIRAYADTGGRPMACPPTRAAGSPPPRKRALDQLRRQTRGRELLAEVAALADGDDPEQKVGIVPDDRPHLVLTCCHRDR